MNPTLDRLCEKLNNILPNFPNEIKMVAHVMIFILEQNILTRFIECVDDSFAPSLKRMIVAQNQLRNAETNPIGTEISNYLNSENSQKTLSVKQHTERASKTSEIIVPILNTTTLHRKTKNLTWFRLRVNEHEPLRTNLASKFQHTYNIIDETIAEIVYESTPLKTSSVITEYKIFLEYFETFNNSPYVDEIIFFSNCMDLAQQSQNANLVYSNIFKFYYCIYLNKLDTTYFVDDLQQMWILQVHVAILQLNLNFNTNKSKTITPLGLLSSEKNNSALLATCNNTFATGTPRESLLLGKGSEIGAISKQDVRITLKSWQRDTVPQNPIMSSNMENCPQMPTTSI
jgi:hypothetical protein